MKVRARVSDVRDGRAWLACEPAAGACGACGAAGSGRGCAMRWLGRPGDGLLEVPARETDGAPLVAGDVVSVEVGDGALLRAALVAYLTPLAGLLAGALASARLMAGGEGATVAAAGAGLALGWVVSRAWLRRVAPAVAVRGAGQG